MHLAKGQEDIVVGQQVGDRVVAGDHRVELAPMVVMSRPHVADREVDPEAKALALGPGSLNGPCRQVGRRDVVTPLGQAEGLGADPARHVRIDPVSAPK